MTETTWDSSAHPRNATGMFAELPHTAPADGILPAPASAVGDAAIAHVFGSAELAESRLSSPNPLRDDEVKDLLAHGWRASRADVLIPHGELDAIVGPGFLDRDDLSVDLLTRAAEVSFNRAAVYVDAGQDERLVMLGSFDLRNADHEVAMRSGTQEVSNLTAMNLSESVLQRLPNGTLPVDVPLLTEAAAFPDNFDPNDFTKVRAFHDELAGLYPHLEPAQRPRVDMLFTWSLNGADVVGLVMAKH